MTRHFNPSAMRARPLRCSTTAWLLAAVSALAPPVAWASGAAAPALVASKAKPAARVYTRAEVRSLPAPGEQPMQVRLKIAPRGKLPFSTLTFQVEDRRLLAGIAIGDEVGFIAERRSAGNTLTALRKVAPCTRFQTCPEITD